MSNEPAGTDAGTQEPRSKRFYPALSSLYLDPNNFRFIDQDDYREVPSDRVFDPEVQRRTARFILGEKEANVEDLIASLTQNGWLDMEPLSVRRVAERRFLVVEGNRRTATLKHLQSRWQNSTGQLGKLNQAVFSAVPCVQYEETDEVHHLVIMGLHHISGKKRWPAVNQARLMRRLRDEQHMAPDAICKSLGVSRREFNLSLRTLSLTDTYRKSDFGDQFSSEMFNLFREVLKAPALRTWLRWDETREAALEQQNLDQLFSWVSRESPGGDPDETGDAVGTGLDPVVTTGAQVRELARIIEDPAAVKRLTETRSLQAATLTSNLLVKNEIDGALERCNQDVGRLFQLAPRMSGAELDRVDDLTARLEAVAIARRREPVARGSERAWQAYTEVPQSHFHEVVVEQYRGVSGLRLEGLGRVNLLVGVNNAGKTSALECIYLLAHQADPRALLETIRRRTKVEPEAHPGWLVDQFPTPAILRGAFDGQGGNPVEVRLDVRDIADDPEEDRAAYLRTLFVNASYAGREQQSVTDFFEGRARRTRIEGEPRWLCPALLHSPFSLSDPTILTRCNEASIKAKSKDRVLAFVRKHLDPAIRDIALVDQYNRFLVTHEGLVGAPDLASFGEGLQRVFQIGLLFAGARGGLVLIDEFENALHTAVLIDFTRFVHELAIEFDVQVFLTTHSKETVDAFILNGFRREDVVAYGLYREPKGLDVVRFGGDDLAAAIEAINLDIRRG